MPSDGSSSAVRISLLGSFELEVNSKPVRLPTRKAEGLLAYLVLYRGIQNRGRLAALFWGDSTDQLARRSLRTALSALRKELGEGFVIADRETIQLNPDFPIWVDVHELGNQIKQGSKIEPKIYRDDLLQDFYDEWVLEEREQYRNLFINALQKNIQDLKANGEYQRAISLVQKIISLDAVNEQAYQQLIFCQHALGNRAEALKSFKECVHQLMEGLGVEPSEDTVALYEQVRKSTTSNTQFTKSNLPIPLTSFIGREQELNTLTEIFSTTRLLTLTGVGGCGKTRLAVQLGTQLASQFADGAWWIELASIQDGSSLLPVLMKSLGIAESQIDSPEESLIKFLRPRHILLVMDNCEHVISACANLIANLLSHCPDVKIFATSREALSIHGEIAWLVPSLSLPPIDHSADLMKWECPRLFFERAITYRSDLRLTESNTEALLRICRTLEGIPLAIELAAARVKTLSLEQLASRLDDKLNLLTTGSRAAQPRQQTLRATIDWSYELLSDQEKIVLQRLSVFYGTWNLEAAELVCADEKIESSQVLDIITRLLDRSLLVSENSDGEIRYRMLEILRQYAMEKLGDAEVQQVQDRHARYYSELAQRVENAWYSNQQAALIKQFDAHYPNVRVALTWGLSDPQRSINWKFGMKLAITLVPFWNFKADVYEAHSWLNKVISQVDAVLAEADLESKQRSGLLFLKARAIYETAALSYYVTHNAAKMDTFAESARLFEEIGDAAWLARANLYAAQTNMEKGNYEEARRIWAECLEQFNKVGDQWYTAMVHSFYGTAARRVGKFDESDRELYEAIEMYSKLGDDWGKSIMLAHLGTNALLQNDPVKARDFFEQRLIFAHKNGFQYSIAYSNFLIGLTWWKSDNHAEMIKRFLGSMPYFYQNGNYGSVSDCLLGLALVKAEADQREQAAYLLGVVEKIIDVFGRKVYFEFEYFNEPTRAKLLSRLGEGYQDAIEKGRNADLDEVIKDVLANN